MNWWDIGITLIFVPNGNEQTENDWGIVKANHLKQAYMYNMQ